MTASAPPVPRHRSAAPVPASPPPSGSRRVRIAWAAAALTALLLVVLGTPWWGRDLAFFRVKHVEVRGTRFVRQSDIAARLKIDTTFSIWSSLEDVRARAAAHPQVRDVQVERRLPGTLVLIVDENLPIALVPGADGFRAYDESGRALPLDPSRVPLDLPVVARPDTGIFRLLSDIKSELPGLYARVSEVRRTSGDEMVIQLMNVPVRVMSDVSIDRFLELSSVEADLERRRLRPIEIDLRFKDQVIARLP